MQREWQSILRNGTVMMQVIPNVNHCLVAKIHRTRSKRFGNDVTTKSALHGTQNFLADYHKVAMFWRGVSLLYSYYRHSVTVMGSRTGDSHSRGCVVWARNLIRSFVKLCSSADILSKQDVTIVPPLKLNTIIPILDKLKILLSI
jgi:hypothetical protein